MNTDAEHSMSFEEQFAAFSGQASTRLEEVAPAPAEPQLPPVEQPFSDPQPVVPAPPAPEPPVGLTAVPSQPVAPVPPPSVDAPPIPADVGSGVTDTLLSELDRATATLAAFRSEIARLVQREQATAAELAESRRQVAALEVQIGNLALVEAELAGERSLVSSIRARLGDLIASLDAR